MLVPISADITNMINRSMLNSEVIADWKLAKVTPIYKGKGDKLDPGNYRPISVIGHIAKILEKLISIQFVKYMEDHKFISQDQSAYLKKHSTQTSLHRVINDWLEAFNEGELVGVCFLDIKKCFDTIDHKLLLQKLTFYGITDVELNWFKSYLTNRKQRVSCNGKISNTATMNIGVPQGSVLGPILFLVYANDIGSYVHMGSFNCFADDTIVFVTGKTVAELKHKLQACINSIQYWYMRNRLVVNASKSNVMLLGTPQKLRNIDINEFQIFYNNEKMQITKVTKYLGVMIDDTLSWHAQVANMYKNVGFKLGILRRLSKALPTPLLSQMYKTYLSPVMEYACTVWGLTSNENINRVQRLQNLTARTVTGNYDYVNTRGLDLVNDLKWQTFTERRNFLLCTLIYKCMHGMAPDYLTNNVTLVNEMSERVTRQHSSLNLYLPRPYTEKFKHSLFYTGGLLWNELPPSLQEAPSVNAFKCAYKKVIWKT
jgi:hypothetical protein